VQRKRRTRQHIIADLAANHVERHVLLCGHVVEFVRHDYGIDMSLHSFDEDGELEHGEIGIQVKATDRPKFVAGHKAIAVRIERRDLWAWVESRSPVLLVLYDVAVDRAHWILVQEYVEDRPELLVGSGTARATVHLPIENVVTVAVIHQLVQSKRRLMPRLRKQAKSHG
jgi:hypothetical protein